MHHMHISDYDGPVYAPPKFDIAEKKDDWKTTFLLKWSPLGGYVKLWE